MDAFFDRAKQMVLETVGLQSSHGPDIELEKWSENLTKLENLVWAVRKRLVTYASAVVEMNRAASLTSGDIAAIYSGSEPRKKSVKRFTDAQCELEEVAQNIFQEQFGWDILSQFDKWKEQISSMKQRVRALDELRVNMFDQEEKVKGLQKRAREPHLATELKLAESQLLGLQTNHEATRAKVKDAVKQLLDARFAQFDGVFVRLMECQVDYFRCASGVVDAFQSNIDNYRKRYPRHDHNDADSNVPPPDRSSSRDAAAIANGRVSFDYDPHLDSAPVTPSAATAAAALRRPASIPEHDDHSENDAHDRDSEHVEAVEHVRSSRSPVLAAQSQQQAPSTSSPLPAQSQLQSQLQSQAQAQAQSQSQAQLQKDRVASPASGGGSGSVRREQTVKSPPTVSVTPLAAASRDEEDILNFSFKSSSAPKKAQAYASNLDLTDYLAPTINIKSTPSSANPSATTSPRLPSLPNSGGSAHLSDPLDFSDFVSAPSPARAAQQPSRASTVAAKVDVDTSFDGLFVAAPKRPVEALAPAVRKPSAMLSPSAAGGVAGAIAARQQEKIDELHTRQAAEEKRSAERFAANDSVQGRVDAWALKNGVSRNLRELLLSLNRVLWPGADWQNPTMEDLMHPNAVKKIYRLKAMTLVHPDKVSKLSTEEQLLAERIFDYLTKAWTQFQVQEKL